MEYIVTEISDNKILLLFMPFNACPLPHPLARRLLGADEGLDPMRLSGIRSSQPIHDVADGHHGLPRGDTSAAAATSAGSEVGGEETDNGKAKNGSGSKTTGGGGANLEKESTAAISGTTLSEGSAAGAGGSAAGDGNGQKSHGGKLNLRTTAARLALKISETSMVRSGDTVLRYFRLSFAHARTLFLFSEVGDVLLGSLAGMHTLREVVQQFGAGPSIPPPF